MTKKPDGYYFDDENDVKVDKRRKKRKRKKKKRKVLKGFMLVLGLIIVAIAAFLGTIKVVNPQYDLKQIPAEAVTYVNEEILGNTTTTTTTQASTTRPSTTEENLTYLSSKEFDFKKSNQGNHLGNILNGGKVGRDSEYIYHIVDKKGIYRLVPSTEGYTKIYSSSSSLSSLNVRGDYLYFVNDDNHKLYKLRKSSSDAKSIAENVKLCYVYRYNVYYTTTDNKLCRMDVKDHDEVVLYDGLDNELDFVGISLKRVYFTITDYDGTVHYYSIDNAARHKVARFREDGTKGQIESLELENGFFYFYELQDNGTYNLCRQKYGSDRIVKLVKEASTKDYVIIDSNRCFYSDFDNGKFKMVELNMNDDSEKVMICVKGAEADNSLMMQHGGYYDFIIGSKGDGDEVYNASSIDTGSGNVMKFKKSKWSY